MSALLTVGVRRYVGGRKAHISPHSAIPQQARVQTLPQHPPLPLSLPPGWVPQGAPLFTGAPAGPTMFILFNNAQSGGRISHGDSHALLPPACMGAGRDAGAETIVRQMQAAWADVHDYRARMLIRTYRDSGSPDTQTFFYTFRKPDQIRIDFIRPHPGMVMIYPDKEGRVFIRPSGLARLFRLHLPPDSPRLVVSAGQRMTRRTWGC